MLDCTVTQSTWKPLTFRASDAAPGPCHRGAHSVLSSTLCAVSLSGLLSSKRGNRGAEGFRNVPRVTQQVSLEVEIPDASGISGVCSWLPVTWKFLGVPVTPQAKSESLKRGARYAYLGVFNFPR